MCTVLILSACLATVTHASEFESRYYAAVFSGDLSWVTDAEPQTPAELALKARFDERFLLRIDSPAIAQLDDPLVKAIARRFHDYWRQALLAPQAIEDVERRLHTDIERLIALGGIAADQDDIDDALARVLAERGFNYRGGRTQPLLDFMLWRNTRTVEYDVELTDTRQSVVVHFLDDFVVRGWSHFATFGHAGTGGWADRDALYCVAAAYDVQSENFKNSYLRHEARHYADYERYPALEAADLEYRGKLTELAFSTDALSLIRGFRRNSNGAVAVPHPLANWHVVHDVARMVDETCKEDPMHCIEPASNGDLNAAARRLIIVHTDKLESLGAEAVSGTLEPAVP